MTYADEKGTRAAAFFSAGYNCSQAVLMAFAEECGVTERQAAKIASSFGGGMGRMREVCGAVSGMFLVLSMTCGYDDAADTNGKKRQYETVRAMADKFKSENGSIVCRTLLGLDQTQAGGDPSPRTHAFYQKRPCISYVEQSARIAAETIQASAESTGE